MNEDQQSLSDGEVNVGSNRSRHRVRGRGSTRVRPEPTFRCLGIRGKSYKKHRRFANGTNQCFAQIDSHSFDCIFMQK